MICYNITYFAVVNPYAPAPACFICFGRGRVFSACEPVNRAAMTVARASTGKTFAPQRAPPGFRQTAGRPIPEKRQADRLKHFPAKPARGLDPRVGTGSPQNMRSLREK
jgi:hypothetical protein